MKKRGWIAVAAAAVLGVSALCFTACGGDGDYDYKITLWVGEGTQQLTYDMIDDFNNADESINGGYKLKATVEIQSESSAAGNAISKPSSCADIFCIAQDQLARIVKSQLTTKPNNTSNTAIKNNDDEESIKAATIGNTIWAFPMTRDNGVFMYYDTSVITNKEDLTDLATLVKDCEEAGKNFSMNLDNYGAWYVASFFYAVGAESEWVTNADGTFSSYTDTFGDTTLGTKAVKGMGILMSSTAYNNSSDASCLTAGTKSAVYISGVWDYNAAKAALGDHLGIAPLPSFSLGETDEDGEAITYQLTSYLGSKLMCIKPQEDAYKASALQYLARYLTSETCQKERFNEVGWGPSNKNAAAAASSDALDVLYSEKTTLQGQYPTNWWSVTAVLAGNAYKAYKNGGTATDQTIQGWLSTYTDSLTDLLNNDIDESTILDTTDD